MHTNSLTWPWERRPALPGPGEGGRPVGLSPDTQHLPRLGSLLKNYDGVLTGSYAFFECNQLILRMLPLKSVAPYPDLTGYNSISFWSCYCGKSLAEQKIVRGMFVKGIGTNPLANKKERGPPSPPVPHSPDNHSPDDGICVNLRPSASICLPSVASAKDGRLKIPALPSFSLTSVEKNPCSVFIRVCSGSPVFENRQDGSGSAGSAN